MNKQNIGLWKMEVKHFSLHPFKGTGFCGPADPCRMTMDKPSDWTAGGLDSEWRNFKKSPLNTRQQQ